MRIAVAGGTGFLGRHISRALIDGGHEVTVLSRTPEHVGGIAGLERAGAARADITDRQALRGSLDGHDAVVNCAQFPNHPMEVPRKGLTYDNYDRKGTDNLLAEAASAGVKRFIYISGAGADVTSDKTWYRAKGFAEDAIERSGLDYCILRPSWAYGPEDKALNKFVFMTRVLPVVVIPGVRTQLVQPVHVDDIALAVARMFEREEAWGRVLEIGSDEVMSMRQVVETLLEVLGKRRLIVHVPAPLAKFGTAPLRLLPKPPMTPLGVDFAIQDGIVDTSEMKKVLAVEPRSLADGLRSYL
jgi:nucleoside-diphosphate-sugar epimerase